MTDLFRILCVWFYQNWPSFIEDATKKHLGLRFHGARCIFTLILMLIKRWQMELWNLLHMCIASVVVFFHFVVSFLFVFDWWQFSAFGHNCVGSFVMTSAKKFIFLLQLVGLSSSLEVYCCNMVEWSWWDSGPSVRPTSSLRCFDTVGLVIWPVKIVVITIVRHWIAYYVLMCR